MLCQDYDRGMSTTRSVAVTENSIFTQAFAWMFGGLSLTGVTSYAIAANESLAASLYGNSLLFYGIIIAEFALVLFLSFRITKMSFTTALLSFVAYAFLNGLTLSAIFFVYTASSIYSVFFITAGVFGIMALYGYTTKTDLTTIGNLALMALIGVIIASVVNFFFRSDTLSYIISYLSVAIFVGLTAYDVQKLKKLSAETDNQNLGILGALTLYLDFINLFLSLLRIFGRRR